MEKRPVTIHTEFIKLDSLLKYCGIASSGGEAKSAIEGGEVLVDEKPCIRRGEKIRPGQKVTVFGQIDIYVEEKRE